MPVILATDLVIFAILGVCVWALYGARKEGNLRTALKTVKANRLALASAIVLCLYFAIALADSVRWRDASNTSGGATSFESEPLSLLDRALHTLRANTEKTYSSPLADTLYMKEFIESPEGKTVRENPKLKHSGTHLLGTDKVGSDVLYIALKGVRTAFVIGAGTTVVIIPFAVFFGVVAGYFGGLTDDVIQYIYTTLSSIPGVLLIVAFMLLFGSSGYQGGLVSQDQLSLRVFVFNDRLFWLCLILGITSWTDLCRLIRGETLKLRELEYVQAARAFGVSNSGILYRHIVPNVMHLVLITFVLQFSGLVLAEAVLSYIGIGVGPETGSWGNMVNTARLELGREPVVWWNLLGAFAFMFALVLPANVFGDAIRDALDPRLRQR